MDIDTKHERTTAADMLLSYLTFASMTKWLNDLRDKIWARPLLIHDSKMKGVSFDLSRRYRCCVMQTRSANENGGLTFFSCIYSLVGPGIRAV